jgi:hypothetical protein
VTTAWERESKLRHFEKRLLSPEVKRELCALACRGVMRFLAEAGEGWRMQAMLSSDRDSVPRVWHDGSARSSATALAGVEGLRLAGYRASAAEVGVAVHEALAFTRGVAKAGQFVARTLREHWATVEGVRGLLESQVRGRLPLVELRGGDVKLIFTFKSRKGLREFRGGGTVTLVG